jgi:hypothetical protein
MRMARLAAVMANSRRDPKKSPYSEDDFRFQFTEEEIEEVDTTEGQIAMARRLAAMLGGGRTR